MEVVKLALTVCNQDFGPVVTQVATMLQRQGATPLRELLKQGKTAEPPLSMTQIKESLLVLLNVEAVVVNCVVRQTLDETGPRSASAILNLPPSKVQAIVYQFVPRALVRRLFYPRMVFHVQQLYTETTVQSELASLVAQELLVLGRARKSKVIATVMASAAAREPPLNVTNKQVVDLMEAMISKRHIVQATVAALPAYHLAGVEIPSTFSTLDGGAAGGFSSMAGGNATSAAAARSRKRKMAPGGPAGAAPAEEDPMVQTWWRDSNDERIMLRFGIEQIIREMRHATILQYVKQRHGDECGHIMDAMLRLSAPAERGTNDHLSRTLETYQVHQEMKRLSIDVPWPKLSLYMEGLRSHHVLEQLSQAAAGGTYRIVFDTLITGIRQRAAESMIAKRFGAPAARIIRLLLHDKRLEEKQVGELALLPAKEARIVLYKLLAAHFIELQEVPRKSDHNPQFTFFLWSVNQEQMFETIVQNLHKGLMNMLIRSQVELAHHEAMGGDWADDAQQKRYIEGALQRLGMAASHAGLTLMAFTEW